MKIGEKNIGFLSNVGAICDYQDWCVNNPKSSIYSANLVKAEYMSREYAKVNGTDFITVAELRNLMPYELDDVLAAVKEAENAGAKRQIETVEAPKKTDKSN